MHAACISQVHASNNMRRFVTTVPYNSTATR
jgi:hypothetical protein